MPTEVPGWRSFRGPDGSTWYRNNKNGQIQKTVPRLPPPVKTVPPSPSPISKEPCDSGDSCSSFETIKSNNITSYLYNGDTNQHGASQKQPTFKTTNNFDLRTIGRTDNPNSFDAPTHTCPPSEFQATPSPQPQVYPGQHLYNTNGIHQVGQSNDQYGGSSSINNGREQERHNSARALSGHHDHAQRDRHSHVYHPDDPSFHNVSHHAEPSSHPQSGTFIHQNGSPQHGDQPTYGIRHDDQLHRQKIPQHHENQRIDDKLNRNRESNASLHHERRFPPRFDQPTTDTARYNNINSQMQESNPHQLNDHPRENHNLQHGHYNGMSSGNVYYSSPSSQHQEVSQPSAHQNESHIQTRNEYHHVPHLFSKPSQPPLPPVAETPDTQNHMPVQGNVYTRPSKLNPILDIILIKNQTLLTHLESYKIKQLNHPDFLSHTVFKGTRIVPQVLLLK